MAHPPVHVTSWHIHPSGESTTRETACQQCGVRFTYQHYGDPTRIAMQYCSQACRSRAGWARRHQVEPTPPVRPVAPPPPPPPTAPLRDRIAWRNRYGASR